MSLTLNNYGSTDNDCKFNGDYSRRNLHDQDNGTHTSNIVKAEENGEAHPVIETCADERFLKGKKDVIILVSLALVYFSGFCAFSIIAPFFPIEAEKKDVSSSITGLIFGVYPFVIFLLSPMVGKYMVIVGPKFFLVAGTFLAGGSEVLFGFLIFISDKSTFIIFGFVIRIVTAAGMACSETAVISVMAMKFPNNMSFIFGMLEVFTGLGMMAGPTLGGFLFKAGGFKLPFIVIGGVLLVASAVVYFVLPSGQELKCLLEKENLEGEPKEKTESITKVLFIPGVFAMSIVATTSCILISFWEPTFTLHLQKASQNSLNSIEIGLFFVIPVATYTVSAPCVGYLTDTKVNGRLAIIVGHFITFLSLLLLGPSPLISSFVNLSLWSVGISVAVFGIAISFYLIPDLSEMSIFANKAGLPDTLAVKGVLSGIFQSCLSIGGGIGPTLGGLLTDKLSFSWTSTIFAFVALIEGMLLIVFTIWESKRFKDHEDREHLIRAEAERNSESNC